MRSDEHAQVVSITDVRGRREEEADRLAGLETPDSALQAAGEIFALAAGLQRPPVDLRRVDRIGILAHELETELAAIRPGIDPNSLAGTLFGFIGNSTEEVRRQLRPFREALNDSKDGAA